MATDVGKVFESELEAVFKHLKDAYLLGWHRFPDTHNAQGAILQPQPSDYLLGLPPGSSVPCSGDATRSVFFEAKASEKHASLQKSAIRAEQRGFIHFYAGMLKLPYLVCHYSTKTGGMQIWDGRAVMEERLSKDRHLLTEFPAGSGRKLNKDSVAQELVEFFSLPHKCKTVKMYMQL